MAKAAKKAKKPKKPNYNITVKTDLTADQLLTMAINTPLTKKAKKKAR